MLTPFIRKDLQRKVVLLSGPRQCGKTTLARGLTPDHDYFNYDLAEDRLALRDRSWRRDRELVVLDELHKMPDWKSWLKGVFDTSGLRPPLLVTGSARLDVARKVGDSMAGRFFPYRLHPFDVKETVASLPPREALERLLRVGGFPEPFLEGDPAYYNRWRRSHLDVILRQDLLDLESVRAIPSLELLVQMLRHRVGSPLSATSLSEDLQRDPKTVRRWIGLLENMCVVFRVPPYHRNLARALTKEPKLYFYDTGQVAGDSGTRLENAVACALLKEIHYQSDACGREFELFYFRNRDGQEIDFLVTLDETPCLVVEVKWSDDAPARGFRLIESRFPDVVKVQVVGALSREKDFDSGLRLRDAAVWLASLDLARFADLRAAVPQ